MVKIGRKCFGLAEFYSIVFFFIFVGFDLKKKSVLESKL